MGCGPDDHVVSSWIEPSGALEDTPADRSASDSVAHDTSEVPVVTELHGASSQSSRPDENDAVGIESHKDTEVDDTATVTGKEQDSAHVVATEVQTVKADKQNSHLDPETMTKQPDTGPITKEKLVAKLKEIYGRLAIIEGKCIEANRGQMLLRDGPLDVTKYLLMIPDAKLILLQDGGMRPEETVCTWYIKVQKDATKGDKKPFTPELTKNSPTTSQDLSATPGDSSTTPGLSYDPEEDSAHPPAHSDVSEKTAPQVDSPEDYLRAFMVALELRAKKHEWSECEQLAAVNAAEIGEEDRRKVIDGKYYLNIGNDLVDQLLSDLKTAKNKAAEEEAQAKAKVDQEAAQAKAAEEASQAKEHKKYSNPDPEATSTRMDVTPDHAEARSMLSNGTQQVTPKETSAEESKVAPEEAEAALEEAAVTQQNAAQDASLSTQESQASAEEVGSSPQDSGKGTVDVAVDAVALHGKTKPETEKEPETEKKPETELSAYVDSRPLNDKDWYRKVGSEWYVLTSDQWIPSLSSRQYAALIALHRTCLDEHHDFFLASQHASASRALRRLAQKYDMPARMWKHAIHSYLEVLRHRLPESQETMDCFIIMAHGMMALLGETVPQFRFTWIECQADLARYAMAIEEEDMKVKERWRDTAQEEYTRVVVDDPTVGRLYHHLAILVPDASFDANVSKLFYYTKSLVVKTPFYAARDSVLTVVEPIVNRNKKAAEKPASVLQTDQDHFLTAVAHLILASLEPETLKGKGYEDSRTDHIQAVYAALEKIKDSGPVKRPRIRPSAQLGLLLCQLLLGIPLVDNRWSPMMAAWAPDLVMAEDRTDSDAMANARDIHDATIKLIDTMVPYLLEYADTRDLRVWEFIYVILVFMRSLKTRPALLKWLGSAFHAEMIAPYLNMLLREDETRGRHTFESASQSEFVTVCSPLNDRTKLGKYGLSTEDNIRTYLWGQEKKRKAETAENTATVGEVTAEEAMAEDTTAHDATASQEEGIVITDDDVVTTGEATVTTGEATVTTEDSMITPKWTQTTAEETMVTIEETTTSDTAHEMDGNANTQGSEQLYANVLPEHFLLSGLPFAKEADPGPRDKPLENPTEDAVVGARPAAPEATPAAVETAEAASPAEVERNESEDKDTRQQDTHTKEEAAEKPQQEDEQKIRESEEARLAEEGRKEREAKEEEERNRREAEEAEVRRQEGLLRNPPLFPNGWLKKSKYDFDDIQVCDYVQSLETYEDRSNQILRLAALLIGYFFIVESDEEKRIWISVSGSSSWPKLDLNKNMPEIVERDSGVRVVYVDTSSHAAEIKKEKERLAREEEMQKEKEKDVEATTEVAAVVEEKANGDAEEVSAVNGIPETSQFTKAIDQQLAQPERPTDHHATATVLAEGPVTDPQASAKVTEDVLNKMPKVENPANAIKRWRAGINMHGASTDVDDDGWTHVSEESHEDAETEPTVETAQVETRSMISRLFF